MKINYLIYDNMTPLDLIGPLQIWSAIPNVQTQLVARSLEPVTTDTGMVIQPTHSFDNAEVSPTIFFAPGGGTGTIALAQEPETLAFTRDQGKAAEWVTSVCTGALILGGAGLLKGYNATTHWAALPVLHKFGAKPVKARWVIDGNRATGGGVTAGIDFGLAMISELLGENTAKEIQLVVEYAPAPPFNSGSPEMAGEEIVNNVHASLHEVSAALEKISGPADLNGGAG